MAIFNNSNKSPLLNNINEIMLHSTLLPESIFNVALASLMQSCPHISANLTKSSSLTSCVWMIACVCMCDKRGKEG